VIPGKNCARTIRRCLDSVVDILHREDSPLDEIIFVDDGSIDDTVPIVSEYPSLCIQGKGGGPGYARNLGWRRAKGSLIWFVDADCVVRPDSLDFLLEHLSDESVAGVGGSYDNLLEDSLLARLIHAEIVERHMSMPQSVTHLGSYNVLYWRRVLEDVGGFDECRFNGPGRPGAEDAALAYRVIENGHCLHFDRRSRVGHHHPTSLRRYLRSQRIHGFWRVALHLEFPRHGTGDTYSSMLDHLQPPLAMLAILAAAVIPFVGWWPILIILILLGLCQVPFMFRLLRRSRRVGMLWFGPMSFIRSFWRGFGMLHGIIHRPFRRRRVEQATAGPGRSA
jgi:GT2 family glycosyltransferase